MRETEGALRAYFLLTGAISVLMALRDLGEGSKISISALPTDLMLAIYVPAVVGLGLGAAYLVAAIRLNAALPTGAGWIKHILVLALVLMTANAALIAVVLGPDLGRVGLIGAIIGVAITVYLYRSVTRLAAEAAERTVTK